MNSKPADVKSIFAEALDKTDSQERAEYLDLLGNKNGRLDVGDFLAWLDHTGESMSASALRKVLEKQR